MARVQLIIPDDDRDRFIIQARLEGMSFSAWLRAAAQTRLEERKKVNGFESTSDVEAFFDDCDAIEGPETEPDWNEHLRTINASRTSGSTGV